MPLYLSVMSLLMTVTISLLYNILVLFFKGTLALLRVLVDFILSEPPTDASTLQSSSPCSAPAQIEVNQDAGEKEEKKKSSKKRKTAKAQETQEARGMSKEDIDKWRASASRKTRKRKSAKANDYDSIPTGRFARFEDTVYIPPPRPRAPAKGISQERLNPVEDTESAPRPEQHFMNSRKAHQWFHTVYRNVKEFQRKDLFLHQGGLPHEFAYILVQGWISLDQCLEWKDGRHTIGQGILDLAEQSRRGDEWVQPEYEMPMGETELKEFTTGWMDMSRSLEERLPYNWALDREDRARYGPFGPALAHFARPRRLETVAKNLIEQQDSADLTCFPDHLRSIFDLLVISDDGDDDLGSVCSEETGASKQAFPTDSHPGSGEAEEETKAAISRLEEEQTKLAKEIEKVLAQSNEAKETEDRVGDAFHRPAFGDTEIKMSARHPTSQSVIAETSMDQPEVTHTSDSMEQLGINNTVEPSEQIRTDEVPGPSMRIETNGAPRTTEQLGTNESPEPLGQAAMNEILRALEQVGTDDTPESSRQPGMGDVSEPFEIHGTSNTLEPLKKTGTGNVAGPSNLEKIVLTNGPDYQRETPTTLLIATDGQSTSQASAPESNVEGQDLFAGLSVTDAWEKAAKLLLEMAAKAETTADSSSEKKATSEGAAHGVNPSVPATTSAVRGIATPAGVTGPSTILAGDMNEVAKNLEAKLSQEPAQGDGDCKMDGPTPVAQQSVMATRDTDVQVTIDPRVIFQPTLLGCRTVEDVEMEAPPMPEYDMVAEIEEQVMHMDMDTEQAPWQWSAAPRVSFPPQVFGQFGLPSTVNGSEAVPIQEEEMVDAAPMPVRPTSLPLIQRLLDQKNEAMKGVTPTNCLSSNPLPLQPQVPPAPAQTETPQIVVSPPSPVLGSPNLMNSVSCDPASISSVADDTEPRTREVNEFQVEAALASAFLSSTLTSSKEPSTVTENSTTDDLPDYVSDDEDDKENAAPSEPPKADPSEPEYHQDEPIVGASESTAASDDEDSPQPTSPVQKPVDIRSVLSLLHEAAIEANLMPGEAASS